MTGETWWWCEVTTTTATTTQYYPGDLCYDVALLCSHYLSLFSPVKVEQEPNLVLGTIWVRQLPFQQVTRL